MRTFIHKGEWWIDFRSKGRGGRKRIGKNKKQAQTILDQIRHEMNQRDYLPAQFSNGRLFSVAADKFWKLHGSTRRSAKSWWYLHKEAVERFGHKQIGSVGTADIQAYYNEVKARTTSTSANKRLTYMKLFFNRTRAWGDFYGENPCRGVHKESDRNYPWRYLEQDEMKRLIPVAHPRLYPVLMCALLTGMRRDEILHMDWSDINLNQGTIRLLNTKSGHRRDVPIPGKLHDVFIALGPKPSGNVFNLPRISMRKYFTRALKQADIEGRCRFHDMRHTFASWFMIRGGNIYTLQKLLGHSTIKMTERYAHLSPGHLKSELATFETVIPVAPTSAPRTDLAPIWHQTPIQEKALL